MKYRTFGNVAEISSEIWDRCSICVGGSFEVLSIICEVWVRLKERCWLAHLRCLLKSVPETARLTAAWYHFHLSRKCCLIPWDDDEFWGMHHKADNYTKKGGKDFSGFLWSWFEVHLTMHLSTTYSCIHHIATVLVFTMYYVMSHWRRLCLKVCCLKEFNLYNMSPRHDFKKIALQLPTITQELSHRCLTVLLFDGVHKN